MLDESVIKIIAETSEAIEQRYEIKMEAMGMDGDHVHLLCGGHPKLSIGSIVRIYKSLTAREIFRRKPEVKKELWGGEFWSDGYYAATVGERGNWAVVEKYVMQQGTPKEKLKQYRLF